MPNPVFGESPPCDFANLTLLGRVIHSARELSFPTRKIAMALPKNVQNQLKMTPKQLKSTQNGSKSAKNAQNRVGSSKFSRALSTTQPPPEVPSPIKQEINEVN